MIDSQPSTGDLFYVAKYSIGITWGQFFVGVALYILSYYLCDDALGYWTTAQVNGHNMLVWIIGALLLPPGLILWFGALFRLASSKTYHYLINVTFIAIVVIACYIVGSYYFVDWHIERWLRWDFNMGSTHLVRIFQGVFLVLTLWLTGLVLFYMFLRVILQRVLYSEESSVVAPESEPLMGAQQAPIQSTADKAAADEDKAGFVPMSEEDKEFAVSVDKAQEYTGIFLFFIVFLPIFMWINCLNVADWHRMYPAEIIDKLMSTTCISEDTWNMYFAFECNDDGFTETCYARLYYDLLLWYLFIFITAMFAYFTNKSPTTRIMLQKRLTINLNLWVIDFVTVTIGEVVFWILWLVMMIFIGYYWVVIHVYNEDDSKDDLEKWARYMGILAIMFMSMGLYCSTRIRLWIDCFMVSSEHLVVYHSFFMIMMLLCGYIHLLLWIIWFIDTGVETWGPFQVPLTYVADNWTIEQQWYIMLFVVPIVYIIGTLPIIRRKYFEWFYYLHLMGALFMVGAILWHASQSWRYISPPLALYVVDRMIRLSHSSRVCKVESLSVAVDGAKNKNRVEVTKLGFSIGGYSFKDGEAVFEKLQFKMGQYVYINISNISLWEWHPFTVAAGVDEATSYLHIQNEGESVAEMGYDANNAPSSPQFTQLLYLLAQQAESNQIALKDIEIHVDGPYGKPFVYDGYERVILVAGGIGVTPCHSIFSTMLSQSMQLAASTDKEAVPMPAVDLIWVAKDKELLSLYTQTFRMYERHNPDSNNKFNVRLFVTRPDGDVNQAGDDQKEQSEFNNVVPGTEATMYTHGRPDWSMVLNTITDGDNNPDTTLVFACGPLGLVRAVELTSVAKGARFYAESFVM